MSCSRTLWKDGWSKIISNRQKDRQTERSTDRLSQETGCSCVCVCVYWLQTVGGTGTGDSEQRGMRHYIKLWTSVPHRNHNTGSEEIKRITALCFSQRHTLCYYLVLPNTHTPTHTAITFILIYSTFTSSDIMITAQLFSKFSKIIFLFFWLVCFSLEM